MVCLVNLNTPDIKARATLQSLAALAVFFSVTIHAADKDPKAERPWCDSFSPDKTDLSDTGKNFFFFLWPGYRLFLQHGKDTRVISVLAETKVVDGVRTRVIEERETKDGKLTAVSRNYFAISGITGDVYCFGEDTYEDGKATGHKATWLAGVNGARFGLMMPGRPAVGDRYYHEVAPGVALDRAEITGAAEDFTTSTGTFERCLRTRESSGLRAGVEERLYAPDVGLVKAGAFVLVRIGCPLCDGGQVAP
jgi:hypothetical protein